MARPVKWTIHLHSIRERVLHSKLETWDRKAVEDLFDVRRVTAQNLMRAIGELSNVGGVHLTSRSSLLEFLDFIVEADDMHLALRARLDTAAPAPPQKKGLQVPIPEALRSVRLADLPKQIEVAPGVLTIRGGNAFEILTQLAVLGRALENDMDSFVMAWNPPPAPPEVRVSDATTQSEPETASMWAELEQMERRRVSSHSQPL